MSKLNLSESRALRRGETIVVRRLNPDTGELYYLEVKLSWDRLYYTCGFGWHRTPKAARLAAASALTSS